MLLGRVGIASSYKNIRERKMLRRIDPNNGWWVSPHATFGLYKIMALVVPLIKNIGIRHVEVNTLCHPVHTFASPLSLDDLRLEPNYLIGRHIFINKARWLLHEMIELSNGLPHLLGFPLLMQLDVVVWGQSSLVLLLLLLVVNLISLLWGVVLSENRSVWMCEFFIVLLVMYRLLIQSPRKSLLGASHHSWATKNWRLQLRLLTMWASLEVLIIQLPWQVV